MIPARECQELKPDILHEYNAKEATGFRLPLSHYISPASFLGNGAPVEQRYGFSNANIVTSMGSLQLSELGDCISG